jgi:hypothetical protein
MRYTCTVGVRLLSIGLIAACLAFLSAPNAHADAWNQKMLITVNQPVEIPGRVLGPGTYAFQLVEPAASGGVVGITDLSTGHFVSFLFTTPAYRPTRAKKPIVEMEERLANAPMAIHKWFYPGFRRGMEFTYPRIKREPEMGALARGGQSARG